MEPKVLKPYGYVPLANTICAAFALVFIVFVCLANAPEERLKSTVVISAIVIPWLFMIPLIFGPRILEYEFHKDHMKLKVRKFMWLPLLFNKKITVPYKDISSIQIKWIDYNTKNRSQNLSGNLINAVSTIMALSKTPQKYPGSFYPKIEWTIKQNGKLKKYRTVFYKSSYLENLLLIIKELSIYNDLETLEKEYSERIHTQGMLWP